MAVRTAAVRRWPPRCDDGARLECGQQAREGSRAHEKAACRGLQLLALGLGWCRPRVIAAPSPTNPSKLPARRPDRVASSVAFVIMAKLLVLGFACASVRSSAAALLPGALACIAGARLTQAALQLPATVGVTAAGLCRRKWARERDPLNALCVPLSLFAGFRAHHAACTGVACLHPDVRASRTLGSGPSLCTFCAPPQPTLARRPLA